MKRNLPILKLLKLKSASTLSILLLVFIHSVLAEDTKHNPQQDIVYPVINYQNKQTSISKNGLSAIFKMRLRIWNDGTTVTVFVLKDDDPIHKRFSKLILNVFPHQLRRAWNKAVFSGSGQAPIELENKKELIRKLEETPGAIGYLSPEDITNKIRILDVR